MKLFISIILITFGFSAMLFGQKAASQTNTRNALMPDLEADGLKGKVKRVIDENDYHPAHIENIKNRYNTVINGKREISSITEYDEKGNRVRRDAYQVGKLFLNVVYGFLEGERISKEEFASNVKIITALPASSAGKKNIDKPKDSRYSYKFTYKYDKNGNRIEETWINNAGDITINDTIIFDKENRAVERIRRHRGETKISSRVIIKYDDKGNLKEQIYINSNDEESEKHDSYVFDSQGNWIKHIVSKQTAYNPKGVEPFLVRYRKITYF